MHHEWLKTLVDLPQDPKDLEREKFVRTGTEVGRACLALTPDYVVTVPGCNRASS